MLGQAKIALKVPTTRELVRTKGPYLQTEPLNYIVAIEAGQGDLADDRGHLV